MKPSPNAAPASVAPPIDPLSIPVIIVNFNRVAHLRKQLAWLREAGQKRIIILDNNSTYKPLLDFYDTVSNSVTVVRLNENHHTTALWAADILARLNIDGPFVYTDSDVVPDAACPKDLIAHLWSVLTAYPQIQKVGPALRIDDLPEDYKFKTQVRIWERQFWRRPAARGLFRAAIDTTWALYRPRTQYLLEPALRTGWPYVARHEPWYEESGSLTEEQQFYAATAKVTHWGRDTLPEWLAKETARRPTSTPKLLHLGCGHELMPGWINLDVQPNIGADIVYDLNRAAVEKLPLENDSVDGFFMSHVFEHIDNTLPMMEELHRVAKPGAKFIVRVPHGGSDDAFEDPTHRRPYFPNSFVYFAQPAYSRADYGYLGDWNLQRVKLVVDPHLLASEGEERMLKRVSTERNIVREMIVELSAVKPSRPRELRLLKWAKPTLTGTPLDEETSF